MDLVTLQKLHLNPVRTPPPSQPPVPLADAYRSVSPPPQAVVHQPIPPLNTASVASFANGGSVVSNIAAPLAISDTGRDGGNANHAGMLSFNNDNLNVYMYAIL